MTVSDEAGGVARGGALDRNAGVAVGLAVGWTSLAVGALTGLVLGLWSFGGPVPVPGWIGDYDALPRRLLRLGHIAFFGLGILSILLARHFGGPHRGAPGARLALAAMAFGNVFLPATLIAAAMFEPAKYLMAVPAMAVTLALGLAARAAIGAAAGGPP
jgi:hypothetical protein